MVICYNYLDRKDMLEVKITHLLYFTLGSVYKVYINSHMFVSDSSKKYIFGLFAVEFLRFSHSA